MCICVICYVSTYQQFNIVMGSYFEGCKYTKKIDINRFSQKKTKDDRQQPTDDSLQTMDYSHFVNFKKVFYAIMFLY